MSDYTIDVPATPIGRRAKALELVTAASSGDAAEITRFYDWGAAQGQRTPKLFAYNDAYAALYGKLEEAKKLNNTAQRDLVKDAIAVLYLREKLYIAHEAGEAFTVPKIDDLRSDAADHAEGKYWDKITAAKNAKKAAEAQAKLDKETSKAQAKIQKEAAEHAATAAKETAEDAKRTPLNLAIKEATKNDNLNYLPKTVGDIETRITKLLGTDDFRTLSDGQKYKVVSTGNAPWRGVWAYPEDVVAILDRATAIAQEREAKHQLDVQAAATTVPATATPTATDTPTAAEKETSPPSRTRTPIIHDSGYDAAVGDTALAEAAAAKDYTLTKRNSFVENPDQAQAEMFQRGLERVGIPLAVYGIDGKYGDETAAGTKVFQKRMGLEETGIADANTIALLQIEEVKVLAAQLHTGTLDAKTKATLAAEYKDVAALGETLSDKAKTELQALQNILKPLAPEFKETDGAIFAFMGTMPKKDTSPAV